MTNVNSSDDVTITHMQVSWGPDEGENLISIDLGRATAEWSGTASLRKIFKPKGTGPGSTYISADDFKQMAEKEKIGDVTVVKIGDDSVTVTDGKREYELHIW